MVGFWVKGSGGMGLECFGREVGLVVCGENGKGGCWFDFWWGFMRSGGFVAQGGWVR